MVANGLDRQVHHRYFLVQRLERGSGWFCGKFGLQYMGSAEYEFGASHQSLSRMRQLGKFCLREVLITRGSITKPVYLIAPEAGFDAKLKDFQQWFAADRLRTKELSFFDDIFSQGTEGSSDTWLSSTIAWWSLADDIMWSLDRTVATDLLRGLENPAVST